MYVRIKGEQASRTEASTLVIAPHSSLLDSVLIFLMNDCPGVIAKHETVYQPILGSEYSQFSLYPQLSRFVNQNCACTKTPDVQISLPAGAILKQ